MKEELTNLIKSFDVKVVPTWSSTHIALMQEYFRRMALWVKHLDQGNAWPFIDLTEKLKGKSGLDEKAFRETLPRVEDLPYKFWTKDIIKNILKWQCLNKSSFPADLPEPFEPLIHLFQSGGGIFYQENRVLFFDGGHLDFRPKNFEKYLNAPPFWEPDRES